MLLILSDTGDTHSLAVEQILVRRGVPYIHWNQAGFPEHDTVTLRYDAGGLRSRALVTDGAPIDLSRISTNLKSRMDTKIIILLT